MIQQWSLAKKDKKSDVGVVRRNQKGMWNGYSVLPSFHYKYMQHHTCIAMFMCLYGPAITCILVASASPIHVPPIQHVLKYCPT